MATHPLRQQQEYKPMSLHHRHRHSTRQRLATATASLWFALWPMPPAHADTAIAADIGYGYEDTRLRRLNFVVGNEHDYPARHGWLWRSSLEINISSWSLLWEQQGPDHLLEFGLTPNFRLMPASTTLIGRPYMELGIGAHLLSERNIGPRQLGSYFHLGSHVGLGLRFGADEQYDIAWRYEHLSNAGLHEPNPGINFGMLRLGYHWHD